jgi:L-rhamnose mutarotase
MRQQEFNKLNKAIDKMANDIMGDKGPEYTLMHDDVLNNFKSTAKRLNTSALKVWATYFDKQVNSVFAHVNHANVKKAESIDSRFADIINYAKLGLALFKDER